MIGSLKNNHPKPTTKKEDNKKRLTSSPIFVVHYVFFPFKAINSHGKNLKLKKKQMEERLTLNIIYLKASI